MYVLPWKVTYGLKRKDFLKANDSSEVLEAVRQCIMGIMIN